MCGPQIRFCLFTFRPIASKLLNSLNAIDILSWLGGAVVKHRFGCKSSQVQFAAPARVLCLNFCFVVLFLLYVQKIFVTIFCNSYCIVNLLSILNKLMHFSFDDAFLKSCALIVNLNYVQIKRNNIDNMYYMCTHKKTTQ